MGEPIYIPRYTVEEFEGFDGQWELWRGSLVAMTPPPTWDHSEAASRLGAHLQRQLDDQGCRCRVVYEAGYRPEDDTVFSPDVMVVCERPDGRYVTQPPPLIVEFLSDATAGRDRLHKRQMYADAGVPHYLLVDPRRPAKSPRWTLLRLDGEAYVDAAVDAPAEIEPHDGCRLRLDPAAVFDENR